jgi:hypothetical protein
MSTRARSTAMDDCGETVAVFSMTMHNLGLARAADELVTMLDSNRWGKFVQAFQTFEFLPGEFDYFLTSQEITRDMVMAIRNIEAKARLEAAMDERKTGEPGYRRPILVARAELPQIAGRTIMPFGYTKNEAKVLVKAGDLAETLLGTAEPALGDRVRRWVKTGATSSPADRRPRHERLAASAVRLDDADLEALYEAVRAERTRRRRKTR